MVHDQMPRDTDRRPEPDDNPFRAYSARNVLARARERVQLIRHWLIRHDMRELDSPARDESPKSRGKDRR
jgi:hypothetical protein